MSEKNWYVVQTKPRKENLAEENLQRQGFTTYCPKTVQPKRQRQRWKKIIEPLFPRYLFVHVNISVDNFALIRSTFGVIGLVRFGDYPAVMPSAAIRAIQQQEQVIADGCIEYPNWIKGDLVEIIEGPFSGLSGVFQRREGVERVSLLLDIIGKQNRFVMNINSIAPV